MYFTFSIFHRNNACGFLSISDLLCRFNYYCASYSIVPFAFVILSAVFWREGSCVLLFGRYYFWTQKKLNRYKNTIIAAVDLYPPGVESILTFAYQTRICD